MSLLALYQNILDGGQFKPDDVQREAIMRLNSIQQAFILKQQFSHSKSKNWRETLQRIAGRKKASSKPPIKGLYLWGGVGRGKTWMMDLFFESLPGERKLRLHFHRVMLLVHEMLAQLEGSAAPLEKIADQLKAQADVLCFDEFFVSDITDAMLLGNLLTALFDRGITLVATSNIPPDQLYQNGLQRARFLPAIAQIEKHCDIMNINTDTDYRLRALTDAGLWVSSRDKSSLLFMERSFALLSHQTAPPEVCFQQEKNTGPILNINHRAFPTLAVANGVLATDFHTLCGEARSAQDYVEISRLFHSVLLLNVPIITTSMEDQARRFLAMVDEFYERQVKLVVSAEGTLNEIYQGAQLKFEYPRCISRLREMQSEEYLQSPHRP